MLARITLLIVVSLLVACSHEPNSPATELPQDVWAEVREPGERFIALLPEGKHRANLLELVAPKRFAELGEKLAQGMGENPVRLAKAMAQRVPGEPLPYDPAFGLTEVEWHDFLQLKDNMQLKSVGSSSIAIDREPSGVIVMVLRDANGKDESLSIDPITATLTTAHGTFSEPQEAKASPNQLVTGPWNSYEWRSGGGGFLTGKNVSVCLGQMEESKEVLLLYRAKNIYTGEVYVDLAIRFSTDDQ